MYMYLYYIDYAGLPHQHMSYIEFNTGFKPGGCDATKPSHIAR